MTAAGLRLYKLGDIPQGLYVDEVSEGYSAYSILKTGKDEFGKALPVVFRSLGDFKTPVYIYSVVPILPIFGLTPFAVRFPSFLFGLLTIPLLFFLVMHLTKNKEISLISCLLLAISPWHIVFSRAAFESTVALFFFLAGVLTFYLSFKKPAWLIVSGTMFAVSVATYHSQRIIIPVVLAIFLFRYKKIILDNAHRIYFIAGLISGIIFLLPTIAVIFTPGFWIRASGLNIFSLERQMPDGFIASYTGLLQPIINSPWFLTTREFLALYFSYLSPRYMFFTGDYDVRSSLPELSTFFVWQFPFYIYGLWVLAKEKSDQLKEFKFLAICLLLISPIPAAVTRDPYSTIRSLQIAIPQIVLIAFGIFNLYSNVRGRRLKIISLFAFAGFIIYSIFKLYSSVFILNDYLNAKAWHYGWKEVAQTIKNLDTNLPTIVDNARLDAYPELAFFLKYDPVKFQLENFEVSLDDYYTNLHHDKEKHLGSIVTRPISWEKDLSMNGYLVGDDLSISLEQIQIHKLTLISEIKYPDGSPAFRIVKTNPEFEELQRKLFNARHFSPANR